MLNITVREALPEECLNIGDEDESLPSGVNSFDGCDWECHFFCGLKPGNWVVDIKNNDKSPLRWQKSGLFFVQMDDDGGCYRKID